MKINYSQIRISHTLFPSCLSCCNQGALPNSDTADSSVSRIHHCYRKAPRSDVNIDCWALGHIQDSKRGQQWDFHSHRPFVGTSRIHSVVERQTEQWQKSTKFQQCWYHNLIFWLDCKPPAAHKFFHYTISLSKYNSNRSRNHNAHWITAINLPCCLTYILHTTNLQAALP